MDRQTEVWAKFSAHLIMDTLRALHISSSVEQSSQGGSIKCKRRCLMFQRQKGKTHSGCLCPGRFGLSLVVVSISDQHLRKAIGWTIMHSEFSLLPVVIWALPSCSGRWCFAGIHATENQAIYREYRSLRSSS